MYDPHYYAVFVREPDGKKVETLTFAAGCASARLHELTRTVRTGMADVRPGADITKPPIEPSTRPLAALGTSSCGGMTRSGAVRIDAIDALRGLVIVLMVLDHVRDFFHQTAFTADPMALDSSDPWLFLTRWVTHLCAPTFVFLAGLSVWLQKQNGKAPVELTRFLLTRGIWLILLEFTLVGVGFNFGWWLFAQVIWAIGFGLIVLALLHRLPCNLILALGVIIILCDAALDRVSPSTFGALEPLWRMLAVRSALPTDAGLLLVAYPAIPWLGIMLLGYGLADMLTNEAGLRRARVAALAATFIVLFLVARGLNLPGIDSTAWTPQSDPLWSAFSFVSVNKYPPSPAYVLMTLGLALSLLLLLDGARARALRPLLTFGRTPLFTYLLHVWIAHVLAVGVGISLGYPVSAFLNTITDPSRLVDLDWGFDLSAVYAAWACILIFLYPLSRWLEAIKRRRRDWWLGYL